MTTKSNKFSKKKQDNNWYNNCHNNHYTRIYFIYRNGKNKN